MRPATVEGGDVHVLGRGSIMIGMSERTTPQAIELLAQPRWAATPCSSAANPRRPASSSGTWRTRSPRSHRSPTSTSC